jgi:hypothetical protein
VAEWYANGEQGPKPEPVDLDAAIREAKVERDGLQIVLDRRLQERADFVARHRSRLRAVARQQREAEATRLQALLDEVRACRENLLDLRVSECWAACWPDEAVRHEPERRAVAGGRARPVQETLQIAPSRIEFDRVIDLLRRDAQWVASVAPANPDRSRVA